ncbi:uncharacterized protein LOC129307305 [Prosopis cineraria]|uniref:uncharacterized protein LOC129299568 n=1 Tax=Prosopis cineraria TaxID=364024 RepID=UPI00240F1CA2|nr:uncharacterized protein LOC129299568 [Prosopis cineraria]XP_054804202.1 uncharacterized protein LOC129307305 [Prosopis cineraria]
MATHLIATHGDNAEVYHGEDLCKQKSRELLGEICLPEGLLPLNDIIEVGHNRSTGFVWLKQKKRNEHRFEAIRRTVLYESEVTAFVEMRRMRKVTGVKSKELFFWVTISDIFIDDPDSAKIAFANSSGISRSFPVSAFQLQEEDQEKKDGN